MEEEWDIVIILDACRYDSFKKIYRKYLFSGKLEKRKGANETIEWLYKNFTRKFYPELVYISGHPGINSLGVSWGKFNAKNKFHKVYDAWLSGWDDGVGTTNPKTVRELALKAIKENPGKKLIVHFMQPHAPYRKMPYVYTVSRKPVWKNKLGKIIDISPKYIRESYWKLRYLLGIKNPLERYYLERCKVAQLKLLYEDNLCWVLEEVNKMLKSLYGKNIVITSDHGEAFGEKNQFFHPPFNRNYIIRDVPFYRIKF